MGIYPRRTNPFPNLEAAEKLREFMRYEADIEEHVFSRISRVWECGVGDEKGMQLC